MRQITVVPAVLLSFSALLPAQRTALEGGRVVASEASMSRLQEDEGHKITGVLSATVASKYFFRGILQEDQGFIFQPNLEVSFGLFEGKEGSLNSGSLTLGTFNSLHTGPTGTGGGNQHWYEGDFYAGLTFGLFDRVRSGVVYTAYASPNGVFQTTEELALTFNYDDKSSWGNEKFSGLQPSLTLAFELDGQADGGNDLGSYAEIGVQPAYTFDVGSDLPVTVAVPLTLGFSLGNYYEVGGSDEAFGFIDLGVSASAPMKFVPARFGSWSCGAQIDFLFLGDNTETINGGENFEVIGSLSASCAF